MCSVLASGCEAGPGRITQELTACLLNATSTQTYIGRSATDVVRFHKQMSQVKECSVWASHLLRHGTMLGQISEP